MIPGRYIYIKQSKTKNKRNLTSLSSRKIFSRSLLSFSHSGLTITQKVCMELSTLSRVLSMHCSINASPVMERILSS